MCVLLKSRCGVGFQIRESASADIVGCHLQEEEPTGDKGPLHPQSPQNFCAQDCVSASGSPREGAPWWFHKALAWGQSAVSLGFSDTNSTMSRDEVKAHGVPEGAL